jgi:hypothetical protein
MTRKLSHRAIRRLIRLEAERLMNPATKLIPCKELDNSVTTLFKDDNQLLGLGIAEYVADPGVSNRRKELAKHDIQAVRAAIRAAKLEEEIDFLSPVEIGIRCRDIFGRHGHRLFPVAGEEERHEPRARWPYLRPLRDCRPSDITAALEERDVGISLDQDARKDLATLQMAAKKANPSLFLSDATMEEIFQ